MLEKYFEMKKAFEIEEQKVQTRINEIMGKVFCHFQINNFAQNDWQINPTWDNNSFICFHRYEDWHAFNMLKTDTIDYNYKIPTRFLLMKNNDILIEISKNINETNIKKLEKENTKRAVLNKLTKEEKGILGVY